MPEAPVETAITPVKPKQRKGELTKKERAGVEQVLTAARFEEVCETLSRTGAKYKSCNQHGFAYSTVQAAIAEQVNRGDDSWRSAWNTALDRWRETLEVEAYRRGHDGVPVEWRTDPVTGEKVPIRWEYSDRMLEVLMKGHFPERYRENIHHSGQLGLEPIDAFANLTAKAKRAIRDIIMRDLEEQREAAERARVVETGPIIEGAAIVTSIEDLRAERAPADD